jgi:N-methylhydantoinase B
MDGESGLIATTDGDTYNFPAEVVETRFPMLVERYALGVDAGGGAGRRRGGFGLIREYRILNDAGAVGYASIGGSLRRPWGLAGGRAGTNNYVEYVRGGDVLRVFEREPERVQRDVRAGYLTVDQARTEYGVLLDPETLEVDVGGTMVLRQAADG